MNEGPIIFVPTCSIDRKNMLVKTLLPDVITFGGSWMIDETALANCEWEALGSYAEH